MRVENQERKALREYLAGEEKLHNATNNYAGLGLGLGLVGGSLLCATAISFGIVTAPFAVPACIGIILLSSIAGNSIGSSIKPPKEVIRRPIKRIPNTKGRNFYGI
jgi:hypothetical protein